MMIHRQPKTHRVPPEPSRGVLDQFRLPIPSFRPSSVSRAQLQRLFEQQTNESIATKPATVGLDDVATHERELEEHADSEKSDEFAASNALDQRFNVPSIERIYPGASQKSEQPTNSSTADKIVEADLSTSIEQENVMDQDAVDMNDAVASAPTSPNPQDTIIANIEGKRALTTPKSQS
jgi:hypothetical protein